MIPAILPKVTIIAITIPTIDKVKSDTKKEIIFLKLISIRLIVKVLLLKFMFVLMLKIPMKLVYLHFIIFNLI